MEKLDDNYLDEGRPAAFSVKPEQIYSGGIRMSPEISELAEALSKAQGAIRGASKDAKNPHFDQQYATLYSCLNACREPLEKNGLSIIQIPVRKDAEVGLETMLMHKSGQWIAGRFGATPVSRGDKPVSPQDIGSALTYLRRQALTAFLGIAQADDDALSASGIVELIAGELLEMMTPDAIKEWETKEPFNQDSLVRVSQLFPMPRDREIKLYESLSLSSKQRAFLRELRQEAMKMRRAGELNKDTE